MKKLTNVLDENSKKEFKTTVNIELENGIVMEGSFNIKDYGKSYATKTASKLLESMENVEIKSIEEVEEPKK